MHSSLAGRVGACLRGPGGPESGAWVEGEGANAMLLRKSSDCCCCFESSEGLGTVPVEEGTSRFGMSR
eukprot:2058499-Rhodomonas_salina.1